MTNTIESSGDVTLDASAKAEESAADLTASDEATLSSKSSGVGNGPRPILSTTAERSEVGALEDGTLIQEGAPVTQSEEAHPSAKGPATPRTLENGVPAHSSLESNLPTGMKTLLSIALTKASLFVSHATLLLKPYWPSLKQWVGAAVTTGLAWVTFLVSPLQDSMFRALWPERPTIIAESIKVAEGEKGALFPVTIVGLGGQGLSPGVLSVTTNNDGIVFSPNQIKTEQDDRGSIGTAFTFNAVKAGTTTVTLSFANPRGLDAAESVTKSITVRSNYEMGSITPENFSGVWSIDLAGNLGTMELHDQLRQLSGVAKVTVTPTVIVSYQVYGYHDGGFLKLHLTDPNKPTTRIVLEGTFPPPEKFINVRGDAYSENYKETSEPEWKRIAGSENPFSVNAYIR